MVASIGAIASPSQGRAISSATATMPRTTRPTRRRAPGPARAWRRSGSPARSVPRHYQAILEGRVPDGPHLGGRGKDEVQKG